MYAKGFSKGVMPHPERGFHLTGNENSDLVSNIDKRGWRKFCTHPDPGCVPLVREFYANLPYKNEDGDVFVRNRFVSFDPETIRHILDVPKSYENYINDTLEEITRTICDSQPVWTLNKAGDDVLHFPASSLTPLATTWFHFICDRIRPTLYTSDVPKKCAIVLYKIVTGKPYNVINDIHSGINAAATNSKLPYPSLITSLCLSQGVQVGPNEEKVAARQPIAHDPRPRIGTQGVPSAPRATEAAGPSRAPKTVRYEEVMERLTSLETLVHRNQAENQRWQQTFQRKINAKLDNIAEFLKIPNFSAATEFSASSDSEEEPIDHSQDSQG